ncbi:MAG: ATP-dependent RNA helicase HrpA [Phycisphaerales bacterium]|nr:MAG: ATP-dependent RNA helicase HrpA [Phycisphaerales bacterium]
MSDLLNNARSSLRECMLIDQGRFRRRLHQLERSRRAGKKDDARLAGLIADIDRSVVRRAERLRRLPKPTYPADLPLVERRDEIAQAICKNQVVVICGETGSGKSTQLPKICLQVGRGVGGLIGHTQPRRIAARSIAARVAQELNSPLGKLVGYKIRFQDTIGPDAYIKIMTDGILLAETQSDRNLRQYDTIIIDEAHERSLNIDFLLGYLKQLLARRRGLKLIVTSATIDPHHFSEHFNDAPVIEVSGRTYPVEVRYRPLESDDPDEQDRDMEGAILDAVDELASIDTGGKSGDILIFLPGERDIRETAESLRKHHPARTEVLPLYARLSAEEQNRVFQPHPGRRVVLATNVAETSLTVPGIRYVVDPGYARISRYSARSKVQRLPVERISQASADQRKGRCGRLAAGVCIRLYAEDDYLKRERYTPPEIQRTNLAGVILQMKALQLGAVEEFPFLDPPKAGMIRDGYETLTELGALDERGELTEMGRQLARLPIDPRLGRMILRAREEDCQTEILVIAAAMSIQDPRERPMDEAGKADEMHEPFAGENSDFLGYLKLWDFYEDRRRHLSWNKLRKCCRENFLSFVRMREWHDIHRQIRMLATQSGFALNEEPGSEDRIHRAVLSGLLSNVAAKKDRGFEYTGVRGLKLHVFPGSCLFRKSPPWIVAAELAETTRLYARCVAKIQPKWIESVAPHLVRRKHFDPYWHSRGGQVMAFERVSLWGLEIVHRRRVPYGPVNPAEARELFIHHALIEGDYRSSAGFFRHNLNLREEIEKLEAKRRVRDLMADVDAQFAFFDSRVPPDVWDGNRFERWRRKAERKQPDLLFMTRGDLMKHPAADVTEESYPDFIRIDGVDLPLDYRHEPGHVADGITLRLPLEMLHRIPSQRMEWLVTGFLREKIITLIRGLPKDIRRDFVPVPDFADACLPRLEFGQGPLIESLGRTLQGMTGIEIPPDAWDPATLPDHLRMNYSVIDENDGEIAAGRDLDDLRMRLAAQSTGRFDRLAGERYTRDGITRWDFDSIPSVMDLDCGEITLRGYPALTDEGSSVALRVFESQDAAGKAMRAGVRRLFMLHIGEDFDQLAEHLPGIDQMRLYYVDLGSADELNGQINGLIADRAFLADDVDVRERAEFMRRLKAGWEDIWPVALEVGRVTGEILATYHDVARMLLKTAPAQWDDALADINVQVEHLMHDGFLTGTPYPWLVQYPRYLRAISLRIDKLKNGGHLRDAQRAGEVGPWWARLREQSQRNEAMGVIDAELESFRWLVEELRVSVFAQELGTAVPVSAKRLEAQWARVRR